MNILIYTTASLYNKMPCGGAETSLKLIAEQFASIGEDVVYATLGNSWIPINKVRIINGVKVIFFNPLQFPVFGSRILRGIRRRINHWQSIPFLKNVIIKEKIDVVHTYDQYPTTFDILKIRRKYHLDFKSIIRVAGLHWRNQCLEKPNLIKKIECVFNNVDKINFISSGLKNYYIQESKKLGMNIINKREIILDIGFDSNIFNKKWVLNKSLPFKIVMVARFSFYQKRHDILMKSMTLLRDKDIKLHFIGEGPNKINIYNLSKKYKLEDKIYFHGYIEQEKLKDLLLNSHLFCMPTDYEGLCKSIIEAMALGIPVLASDVAPINDYIKDKENGFLSENTPEAWAKNILDIYNGKYNLNKISKNEIDFVRMNYDPDKNILLYKNEFEKTMSL